MIKRHHDGEAKEADGRASVPVGLSVATPVITRMLRKTDEMKPRKHKCISSL